MSEKSRLAKRLEHSSELNHLCDIDDAVHAVIESDAEPAITGWFDRDYIVQHRVLV